MTGFPSTLLPLSRPPSAGTSRTIDRPGVSTGPAVVASTSLLACFLAAWLVICASARASTFVVDTAGDSVDASPGDGVCADAEGACSLRAAIMESNALADADTVELPAGVYALALAGASEDASRTGDLDIAGDLVLRGAGSGQTRIDGAALDRVIDLLGDGAPRSVRMEALSIENGFLFDGVMPGGTGMGAGLRVGSLVALALEDVVLRGHRMQRTPGGIAIDSQGCIQGRHVRITGNGDTRDTGSGSDTAAVSVHGTADAAGTGACLVLEDSEISGNLADSAGAIHADYAQTTLRRSLIADNEARFAGAMLFNRQAHARLENVTISGNRGDPGAILNDGGSHLELVNSSVTRNGPRAGFGALVGGLDDVHGGFGFVFFTNTIVADNGPGRFADDCNAANSRGGNLIGDAARCRFSAQASDQLGADPELGPLADNGGHTRTHLPGAAAIDRGRADGCPGEDQRGRPRPADGDGDGVAHCDIGAVEVQPDAIFRDAFEVP